MGHGHTRNKSKTKTYRIWQSLRRRCNSSKDQAYKYYGGRGITVCERWNKFENFLADMGIKPEGLTLERIKNDSGYYPKNCKWATRQEQAHNTRSNKLNPLKVQVIKKLLKESNLLQKDIAEIFSVADGTIADINTRRTWF